MNYELSLDTRVLLSGMIGIGVGVAISVLVHNCKSLTYMTIKRKLYAKKNSFYIEGSINSEIVYKLKKFMLMKNDTDELNIIIDTYGGSFSSAQIISDLLSNFKGQTNAYVLNNAFSAGTLIALSCKTLYMHKNAHLSPVDVIHCDFFDAVQFSSIKTVIENKSKDRIDDKTFLLSDQAEKCKDILQKIFKNIIGNKYNKIAADKIYEEIFSGEKYIHSTAFSFGQLKEIGLDIREITQSDAKNIAYTLMPYQLFLY